MSNVKTEPHLDWSAYAPSFLDNLKDQPIRDEVMEKILYYIENDHYSKIMEIGFGNGYEYKRIILDNFLDLRGLKYVGVEYTEKFVEAARKKYPAATWYQGDIRKLKFKTDEVDLVFLYHVLEHQKGLFDVGLAIKELCRVARDRVVIVWFKAPSLVDEAQVWKDGGFWVNKYSAADIWGCVQETDFIVKEIIWENPWHNTVWVLEKKRTE